MNKLCIYCNAKHFLCEMNTEKCFINCCHNGKVLFNNEDISRTTKTTHVSNTKDSKNFMNNFRIYNNLFMSASFGAKLVTFPTACPQVFRVRIPIMSQHIDPMICPLLFPRGECG